MRKFFHYIEFLWLGTDGRMSLRATLAIAFSYNFIYNLSYAISKWSDGRSMESLSLVLGIEAGLIVSLLGITAYTNVANKKIESDAANPTAVADVINVASAQNVGAKTTAETVNAKNIETVNTDVTNLNQKIDNPDG